MLAAGIAGAVPASEPAEARSASLTAQQREVAGLAAAGLTNRQIADRLFISPRTVAAHLRAIFGKLDVRSRAAIFDALEMTQPGPD